MPHGQKREDVLSEITAAGFCSEHKDEDIRDARGDIEAGETIQNGFIEPFGLRDHQVKDLFAMAASIGTTPGAPGFSEPTSTERPMRCWNARRMAKPRGA